MAKDKDKKKKKDKGEEKQSAPEFKFGVTDLAKELDIEPASVRVQLRNRKVEKAGKSYGWNTQKEFDEVVKLLKSKPAKGEGDAGDGDSKKDKKKKKKKDKGE